MKIETILNALQFTHTQCLNLGILKRLDPYSANDVLMERRERQWLALRARIIRMVEERDEEMFYLLDMVDDD